MVSGGAQADLGQAPDPPRPAATAVPSVPFELRQPKAGHVPLRAVAILGGYAACCALTLVVGNWGLTLVAVCAQSFILAGFLNAAHDCVHRTHVRSARGNRILGAAWCTPVLLNFSVYRYQHLLHHRFAGVNGDTESGSSYAGVRQYLAGLLAVGYWRFVLSISVAGALRRRDRLPRSVQRPDRWSATVADSQVICAWLAVVIAATVLAPMPLLLCYWLPLVVSGPATLLLSLPEHYGLRGSPDWASNSRSVRSNPLIRFVIWNANYHAEHHAVPWVAAVNLPLLHKAMRGVEYRRERSYLAFHLGLLRSLRGAGHARE